MNDSSKTFLATAIVLPLLLSAALRTDDWPQWRGPLGTGTAPNADPPVEWSETKNIRWKVALPGKGHSTPIVWGDRIFLTTAVPFGAALPPRHSTAPGTHDGVPVTHQHEFVVLAVDRRDGKILWQKAVHKKLPHEGGHYTGGLSSNIVATPVAAEGMLFAGSSYEKRALLAIRLDRAQGDITGTDRIAWTRSRGTPYVPSPLLYGDAIYFLTHYQGVLSRVDAVSGADKPGAIRLGSMGNIYASPVAGGGRVYVTDLDGKTIVLSHGDVPRILAVNILDEEFAASAAMVGRELILRGKSHLYCIAADAGL